MNTLQQIVADQQSVSLSRRTQAHFFVTFDSVMGVLSEASKVLTANVISISDHADTGDEHDRMITIQFGDDEENKIHDSIQTLKEDDSLEITINYMNLRRDGAFGGEVVRFHRLANCEIITVRYSAMEYMDGTDATIEVDFRFASLNVEKV